MSRGFNTTLGAATTDKIVSAYTALPSSISIALFVNRNGDGGDTYGAFCEAESDGGQNIIFGNDSGNNGFRFFRGWGAGGSTGARWWAPRAATGAAHHYGVSYNGSATTNDPLMYLDGVSQTVTQDTANPSGTINTTAGVWALGNRNSDHSKCWDGTLEGFAIWTRILSAGEFAALAAGVPPESFSTNLVESVPMISANTGLAGTPTITGTAVQASMAPFYAPSRKSDTRRFRRVA